MLGSDTLPRALARDHTTAELTPADRAMLDYARTLTTSPHAITRDDVEKLKAHGFDDAAVLDICQVASYYAYVNRLADGLGVELEPEWEGRELTMTGEEFEARVAERHSAPGAP